MDLKERKTQAIEWVIAIAAVAVLFFVFVYEGGDGILSPKVSITHRTSMVRSDFVLQIKNNGSKPLYNVAVKSAGWNNRVVVSAQLNPGAMVEAGWAELPEGCQRGKKYKVSADGYMLSTEYKIPEK
jgi:hypothetical protein